MFLKNILKEMNMNIITLIDFLNIQDIVVNC